MWAPAQSVDFYIISLLDHSPAVVVILLDFLLSSVLPFTLNCFSPLLSSPRECLPWS